MASQNRSISSLSSDSVGSTIKLPATGQDIVGAWKPVFQIESQSQNLYCLWKPTVILESFRNINSFNACSFFEVSTIEDKLVSDKVIQASKENLKRF